MKLRPVPTLDLQALVEPLLAPMKRSYAGM